MDVGFYLGELLMQRGEVSVPGLGSFLQVRMSAYYDKSEALFYPPYNKVHFEPGTDVDDADLAEYLVTKKGISLASAKYFIEKYITNLQQQAMIADVSIGNIGLFYTDRARLSFKPNDKLADDPEFYGFGPVKINKANAIPSVEEAQYTPELVYPRPKPEPQVTAITEEEDRKPVAEANAEYALSPAYDEGFLDLPEEEKVRRGPLRAILITLVAIAVLATGVFALYRYQPATFEQLQFWKNNKPPVPVETRPSSIIIPELDSAIPDSAYTDSTKTPLKDSLGSVADTLARRHFELITGKGFKNLWGANEAVKKYRAMGLVEAKLAEDTPGPLIKISLGTFGTISESEAMRQKLIEEKKLTNGAYTVEIANQ